MDRERLKEIHQTDLTESKVNEDFVDWLKNKGPTWLLVILVAVCVYLGWIRIKQGRAENRSEAWRAYYQTDLPGSLEEVAAEFGDVEQLGNLAYLKAADRFLEAVQGGKKLSAGLEADAADTPSTDLLTDEDRDQYLTRADGLYRTVAESVVGQADLTILALNALNGRAAVAECRGEAEAAQGYYIEAADLAEATYPGLASLARDRAESAARYAQPITFLTQRELDEFQGGRVNPEPAEIDEALREFLFPDDPADDPAEDEADEEAGG